MGRNVYYDPRKESQTLSCVRGADAPDVAFALRCRINDTLNCPLYSNTAIGLVSVSEDLFTIRFYQGHRRFAAGALR